MRTIVTTAAIAAFLWAAPAPAAAFDPVDDPVGDPADGVADDAAGTSVGVDISPSGDICAIEVTVLSIPIIEADDDTAEAGGDGCMDESDGEDGGEERAGNGAGAVR